MRKLMFAALVAACAGCDYYGGEPASGTAGKVRKAEIDGHVYLYVVGEYANGGICHAESCPCKRKEIKDE